MASKHSASNASAARDDERSACLIEVLESRHSRQVPVIRMDLSMQQNVLVVRVMTQIRIDSHHIDALTMLDSQRLFGVSLPACKIRRLVHVQPYP